jgi:large subunit ribosomal protein L15
MAEKKSRKKRGSRTHGWGAGKKHRGAGNRGGRGRAGMGKRGQQRKTLPLSQGKKPVGKIANNNRGMRVVLERVKKSNVLNLVDLQNNMEKWTAEGKAEKTKTGYSVDLEKIGYTKLLSQGEVTFKLSIKINSVSAKAKEKLEAAGGKIELRVSKE